MAKKPKTAIERREEPDRIKSVVTAFQDVTDGMLDFAKTHVELAKAEARTELSQAKHDAAMAGVGGGLVLLGGGTLSLSLILLAGTVGALTYKVPMIGGIIGMTAASVLLGIVYVYMGVRILRPAMERLNSEKFRHTKSEMKRSSEWAKEISETS